MTNGISIFTYEMSKMKGFAKIMSFAYMPMYTADYLKDTRHLTPEEHGIYVLLIMHCWDSRGPVPKDERRQCGIVNARSGGEIESLRRVLQEFFVLMDDGFYNARVAEEIANSERISAGRRNGGLAKARKMRSLLRSARAEHKHNSSMQESVPPSPSSTPTSTSTPTPQNQIPGFLRFEVWNGFIEHRKKLRKPLSAFATRLVLSKLEKAHAKGHDPNAMLETSIERGWIGVFEPDTLASSAKPKQQEAWWSNEAATQAKARSLGLTARGGETWQDFRGRIMEKINATKLTN